MFYKFDKTSLCWEKNVKKVGLFWAIIFLTIISSFTLGRVLNIHSMNKVEYELLLKNTATSQDNFSKEKFVDELKRLNVKFPHIVMAQSIIETGYWNSKIVKESNNLFGMKEALTRVNTAKGTQFNHAFYDSWRESIYDYAFWQCRYMGGVNNEQEYYAYLSQVYAEDSNYIQKLKKCVVDNNLQSLFNVK